MAAIQQHCGAGQVECELVPGGGGIFDVEVDGAKIFSKHDVGRFPEHDEILTKLD